MVRLHEGLLKALIDSVAHRRVAINYQQSDGVLFLPSLEGVGGTVAFSKFYIVSSVVSLLNIIVEGDLFETFRS